MMATTGVCIRFEKTDAITGTMIDLYADAEFMDFTFLRKILEEEIEKLYVKEKVWEVYTGTQVRTGKGLSLFHVAFLFWQMLRYRSE
jgi:hypothetical protein